MERSTKGPTTMVKVSSVHFDAAVVDVDVESKAAGAGGSAEDEAGSVSHHQDRAEAKPGNDSDQK